MVVAMNRYRILVLARPMTGGPDEQFEVRVVAAAEENARRMALERAWYNGFYVTRFLSVTKVERRPKP